MLASRYIMSFPLGRLPSLVLGYCTRELRAVGCMGELLSTRIVDGQVSAQEQNRKLPIQLK